MQTFTCSINKYIYSSLYALAFVIWRTLLKEAYEQTCYAWQVSREVVHHKTADAPNKS